MESVGGDQGVRFKDEVMTECCGPSASVSLMLADQSELAIT
jgi:hypothetical protein